MPNEEVEVTPHSKLMSKNEIISLAKTFVKLGVNKIRLTGGEPLIRKDVAEIIEALSLLKVALTMTTNGALIHKYIDVLKKAIIHSDIDLVLSLMEKIGIDYFANNLIVDFLYNERKA